MDKTTEQVVPNCPLDDFNVFLHELRSRELQKIPGGAQVFLSGGCSGAWYFEWIKSNYAGITKHIGVEAYSPRPDSLPPEVEWINNHLGNMSSIASSSVDLVFAGQTVEHMWTQDLISFLCESHRVLNSDGLLVLDSPNRRITQHLGWYHPQHTVEFNVDEIVELVQLCGFEIFAMRGVWLCYDSESYRFLPLDPTSSFADRDYKERVLLSTDRPEDCFTWWLEARKKPFATPHLQQAITLANKIYAEAFQYSLTRSFSNIGQRVFRGWNQYVETEFNESGYAVYGPYVPLQAGFYRVVFNMATMGTSNPRLFKNAVLAEIDASCDCGARIFAKKAVTHNDMMKTSEQAFDFELKETTFGIEFRVLVTGALPLQIRVPAQLLILHATS
ncbi:MAG: class I SAM-dependent methyltransferase [Myxacorys chilensis ATA2-1-KO14]|jgi:SAM-dependent methyltransferase|nr:class I SAM-dependent methyltransferase [Myxacorys chilensis ATA2-1-KO14]